MSCEAISTASCSNDQRGAVILGVVRQSEIIWYLRRLLVMILCCLLGCCWLVHNLDEETCFGKRDNKLAFVSWQLIAI
jgi:hypothetical protein